VLPEGEMIPFHEVFDGVPHGRGPDHFDLCTRNDTHSKETLPERSPCGNCYDPASGRRFDRIKGSCRSIAGDRFPQGRICYAHESPPTDDWTKISSARAWSMTCFVRRKNTSTGPFEEGLCVTDTIVPSFRPRSESCWTILQSPRINAIFPLSLGPRSVIGMSFLSRNAGAFSVSAPVLQSTQFVIPLSHGPIGLPCGQREGASSILQRAHSISSERVCSILHAWSCTFCRLIMRTSVRNTSRRRWRRLIFSAIILSAFVRLAPW